MPSLSARIVYRILHNLPLRVLANTPVGLQRSRVDRWGWLFPLPTALGAIGVQRALALGQDDRLSWLLIPLLGVTLSVAMLSAIVYALTPDERWNERFNAGMPISRTGWATIIGATLALLLGAGVLMATVAFSGQRFFEYQAGRP